MPMSQDSFYSDTVVDALYRQSWH